MINSSSLAPLGEVLVEDRNEVQVEPDRTYRMAGIYSFGRGLFQRSDVLGAETSYKVLFQLNCDQFIFSRLNGWEGAIDVVPQSLDGYFVSNEYPTFSIRTDRADPEYLRWVARWPSFWAHLIPRGSMVRRKRVQPEQVMEVEIPLPPLPNQKLIVELLNAVHQNVSRMEKAQLRATHLGEAMVESAIWDVFQQGIEAGWPVAPLHEVAEVNPSRDRLPSDQRVGWAPMQALNEQSGTIDPEERKAGDVRSGYKQFRKGDVLFARITPSMQNGKCAIFSGPLSHGYGSTEFHVIRPEDNVQARWIHRFLRTREIRTQAANRFTGTAGQQRVPADFLRCLPIPVPPKSDRIKALRKIDRIVKTGEALRERREKSLKLRAAIEPAALNQVFSSF